MDFRPQQDPFKYPGYPQADRVWISEGLQSCVLRPISQNAKNMMSRNTLIRFCWTPIGPAQQLMVTLRLAKYRSQLLEGLQADCVLYLFGFQGKMVSINTQQTKTLLD